MPVKIHKPLSITVNSGNEIVLLGGGVTLFAGDRQHVIVYNVVLDEYKVLNDDKNYKSICVDPCNHCVFKRNDVLPNENTEEEYISCDKYHFAVYKHSDGTSHSMKNLKLKNNQNVGIPNNALCTSLLHRNGMFICACP